MLRKRQERQEMSNKRTVFRVRGEIVDEAKIDRWQKRSENTGWLQMIDPTASREFSVSLPEARFC